MGKYIHKFNNYNAYELSRVEDYQEPWISYWEDTTEGFESNYNKSEQEYRDDLPYTPLTFEINKDGNVIWKADDSTVYKTIEYKLNDGNWTEITSTTSGVQIPVRNGDLIRFRGNNASYGSDSANKRSTFNGSTCGFSVRGNIMSMVNGSNFSGLTSLSSGARNFANFFYNCKYLTDASGLVLPALGLQYMCYAGMFNGCSQLVYAPLELPAETLTEYCYGSMFYQCSNLITTPRLPSMHLATNCYSNMFFQCTSLIRAPKLPARNLAQGCYLQMFMYCSNLNYIQCLATDLHYTGYSGTEIGTYNWLANVSSSGTFVKRSNADWSIVTPNNVGSYPNGIPKNWTVEEAEIVE